MRLLLLMPTTTYQADDFVAAADELGVDVVYGSDRCHQLEEQGAVTLSRDSIVLDFLRPDASVERIEAFAREKPFDGVLAVDDQTTVIAALASARLGLPHNPPEAAAATRDKLEMRRRFEAGGVRQARYHAIAACSPPEEAAREAARMIGFPCVLKPRMLAASRGVIRADDQPAFADAFARIARILGDPEVKARGGERSQSILIESFLPGFEVSLEGLLTDGELETLALFDKPDPLDGPYFEETIYVTPSRLPPGVQAAIAADTAAAARALGLREGPLHAELRIDGGVPSLLEIAPRSIGGLCARALRFGSGMSLEQVLIRHALWRAGKGDPVSAVRPPGAAGVMMIPIPRSGVFHGIDGLDSARAVPGIEEITITAVERREILALPEGSSYLGFIFARAPAPETVESSLRTAFARLDIRIVGSLRRAE